MSAVLTSQVTQLLYQVTPILNFAQVMGDLRQFFAPKVGDPPILTWDCDDIALLDFGAARIVIGFSDNLPGPHVASLTLAIGQSVLANGADVVTNDQLLLCGAVAERLVQRFPCDAQRSQTLSHPHPLTSDLIDRVVDGLYQQAAENTDPATMQPVLAEITRSEATSEPGDMERLMHRLSSELTARTPSLITRAIASATPRGRTATEKNQAALMAGTRSAETKASDPPNHAKGGLFWRKGQPSPPTGSADPAQSVLQARPLASSSELKAVRDALYAKDAAHGISAGRVAAQTRHALQMLAALPHSFAAAVADKRRQDVPPVGTQIKH
jgi:hypothetical protein